MICVWGVYKMGRIRRNVSLSVKLDKDMKDSGLDISEWVREQWINSKYSITSIEDEIEILELKLDHLKKRLKENKDYHKKLLIITDKREIELLKRLHTRMKKVKGDIEKEDNLLTLWKNQYHNYFKLTLSKAMVNKKYHAYLEQLSNKKEDKNK